MEPGGFDEQVAGVAALDHPISKRVYALVRGRQWVTRDDAAQALDLPRSVAAFHLDKLVDAALLTTRYERLSGRSGPGAGRPAKLYGRSEREISVSLPAREYELAGTILADALARASADSLTVAGHLGAAARQAGARMAAGASEGEAEPARPARRSLRAARKQPSPQLLAILRRHGYEPQADEGSIRLVNCPFHSLAEQYRPLVCTMNLELLTGVIDGAAEAESYSARLAPAEGYCCVRIDPRD